jgi:hypothetical protein
MYGLLEPHVGGGVQGRTVVRDAEVADRERLDHAVEVRDCMRGLPPRHLDLRRPVQHRVDVREALELVDVGLDRPGGHRLPEQLDRDVRGLDALERQITRALVRLPLPDDRAVEGELLRVVRDLERLPLVLALERGDVQEQHRRRS